MALKKAGVAEYVHQDHLGGTAVTTGAPNGALVSYRRYEPFGDDRDGSGTLGTERQFTGQRLDATGLYYYNARYYDPGIGRFVSPDPIVPEPLNPQAWNRYTYVLNNPLIYTDPTGHCGVAGAAVGAGAYTLAHGLSNRSGGKGFWSGWSPRSAVQAGAIGAVTCGLGAVVGGIAGASAEYVLDVATNRAELTLEDAALAVALGAAAGKLETALAPLARRAEHELNLPPLRSIAPGLVAETTASLATNLANEPPGEPGPAGAVSIPGLSIGETDPGARTALPSPGIAPTPPGPLEPPAAIVPAVVMPFFDWSAGWAM